jgi:hypothetical protein
VVQQAPQFYQDYGGTRHTVTGRHVLLGNGQVGFQIDAYDNTRTLVIDPQISMASYLGGSGDDYANGIATDVANSIYLTGNTYSTNFPTRNGVYSSNAGGSDIFVTKLTPNGATLVYSTYLGGSSDDAGNGIAVDLAGNAYIAATTTSTNVPTAGGPVQSAPHGAGASASYIAQLNPTGDVLLYGSYLGGGSAYNESAYGVAIRPGTQQVYFVGVTQDNTFPTTTGAYQTTYQPSGTGQSGWVASLDLSGRATTTLTYASYLGATGTSQSTAAAVAVTGAGEAVLTGNTNATNFPTTSGVYRTTNSGGIDAFLTKFTATGNTLVYSTYVGGGGNDYGLGVALDSSGAPVITGQC